MLQDFSEKFLLNNNKLEKINFYGNFFCLIYKDRHITDNGLKHIVENIKFNKTITSLELQCNINFLKIVNNFEEKSIIHLNELFKYNKTITNLNINCINFFNNNKK
jgi:hypothetical protein